ncbi:aldehyde dehydrogenase [Sinomonas cellulolyticus]|uniref:Aldehyde dehydrogenase n=1 Tax=Sinomonas cellulolyticus TaxID=2801916 RepID=A0ABS1K681_9MICC|nr:MULTISPECIES: aldehyde dehydrogenase family protein [Sinomonas]MBL0707196.1 aldehyde dehydrogenase [Sinomonas cellulolyticus]GHG49975.1 aldehyde dehydrogenase [Sinomonas sp. KCTC 49339]
MSELVVVPLHIGGEDVAAGGGTYVVVNPSTEKPFGEAPEATIADVQAAVDAANAAAPAWAATPRRERARLLHALADRLDQERGRLVPWLGAEMGGVQNGSAGRTLDVAIEAFRAFGERANLDLSENYAPRVSMGEVVSGVARRRPVGVVAVIAAYNAPLVNTSTMAGPALAAGNTVIIKPAPQDPLTTLELARIATEVGFPPGVVNTVNAVDPEIGRELVRNTGVHGVGFTGSPTVGVEIAQAAAAQLKPVLLELGGKGACIVLDDADLDIAVNVLSLTWRMHSGQICGAPTRAIVHESVRDELVRRLAAVAETLVVGPGDHPQTTVGPVINGGHRDRIEGYIASAREAGATTAVGGSRPDVSPGFYAAPTLLVDCTPDMAAVREEIFGPVISMITITEDDEAVAIANDSDYGLVNYVVSGNSARALSIAERLESGVVSINTPQSAGNGIEEMPFGGRKLSGFGRKGGIHAMLAFTEPAGIVLRS